MSDFKFYRAEKAHGEQDFQFPKVLMYSEKYKYLSSDAKIGYIVLKDCLQQSYRNNWIDEHKHLYLVYSNRELMMLLNCDRKKVDTIITELKEASLLIQARQGFDDKKGRIRPNRLYVSELETDLDEFYNYSQLEKEFETLDCNKDMLRKPIKNLTMTHTLNLKEKQEKKKDNDTYKHQTDLLQAGIANSNTDPKLEADLIKHYLEDNSVEHLYGKKLTDSIKKFSLNNFDRLKLFYEKIHYANKGAEKELGFSISVYKDSSPKYQFYQEELNRTFWKCIQAEKYGKVADLNSYLFSSFKNTFLFIGNDMKKETEKHNSLPTHDWSEEKKN